MVEKDELFVLILDGDGGLMEKTKEAISITNVKITYFEASTAEEALKVYEENPINIGIIDVDVEGARDLMIAIKEDEPDIQLIGIGHEKDADYDRDMIEAEDRGRKKTSGGIS